MARKRKKRATRRKPITKPARAFEPIPSYPPEQLDKYVESLAYFADEKQAAIDSGLPVAHARHIEKTDPAFQKSIESARASGYTSLKLSVHRALRAGVDKGDKSSIERALKILAKAGIETGFDEAALKPKKRSIGPPPKSLAPRIAKIYWREINAIQTMQESGQTLTGEQLKFLKTMKEEEAAKATPGQIRESVQLTLEKRLQMAREESFNTAFRLLTTSTRDDVRMTCAAFLKDWADTEKQPEAGYELVPAQPQSEKVINISTAFKPRTEPETAADAVVV